MASKVEMTMATSEKINISKLIRDYAAANQNAKPKEIAEALSQQTGTSVSNLRVSTTLSQARKKSGESGNRGNGKSGSAAEMIAALNEAASFVKAAGGFEQAQEVLKTLAKLRVAQ